PVDLNFLLNFPLTSHWGMLSRKISAKLSRRHELNLAVLSFVFTALVGAIGNRCCDNTGAVMKFIATWRFDSLHVRQRRQVHLSALPRTIPIDPPACLHPAKSWLRRAV